LVVYTIEGVCVMSLKRCVTFAVEKK
jgi:hypothetical protein